MMETRINYFKLRVMGRVLGLFLIWPFLCSGQYVDTVQGRLTVKYNDPNRIKFSVLAGGAFETQSVDGGVMVPVVFTDVHFKPVKRLMLHAAFTHQFQLGWQFQQIKDTRNMELGARVFLKQQTIDKTKTFTAGNTAWNYDYLFPVKVLWNLGISGSYKFGHGVFNTGVDHNTGVRFMNSENQKLEFLEHAAIPYSFSETSLGFVVSTSSSMKMKAYLPNSSIYRSRRMKTLTEFRAELIFGNKYKLDGGIDRKLTANSYHYTHYDVVVTQKENWGFKVQGIFRRKLMGFKVESGIRPGIHYRFSQGEKDAIVDRSYLLFGIGFGWM
jgi:hypothetical protein